MEKFLVGLLALVAVASGFYGVIMRYVFRTTPDWIEEIIIYMIIWAVFISASTLAEEKGTWRPSLLVERLYHKGPAHPGGLQWDPGPGILRDHQSGTGSGSFWQTYACNEKSPTVLHFPLWICLPFGGRRRNLAQRTCIPHLPTPLSFERSEILESR